MANPRVWFNRIFPPYHVTITARYLPATDDYAITAAYQQRFRAVATSREINGDSDEHKNLVDIMSWRWFEQLKTKAFRHYLVSTSPIEALRAARTFPLTEQQFLQFTNR